ncbi:Uncharacterised protein [Acinetobacter baumannii]|nr:Uncharacterised protein [Acinetobacter baumannii]
MKFFDPQGGIYEFAYWMFRCPPPMTMVRKEVPKLIGSMKGMMICKIWCHNLKVLVPF